MGPCPFCIENDLVKPIAQTNDAYLVQAIDREGPLRNRYLVIPKEHLVRFEELPRDFLGSIQELIAHIPGFTDDWSWNLSLNQRYGAGQRVAHLHLWIIIRIGEEGLPSHTLGMNALMEWLNKQAHPEE